eukprot:gene26456-17556_t
MFGQQRKTGYHPAVMMELTYIIRLNARNHPVHHVKRHNFPSFSNRGVELIHKVDLKMLQTGLELDQVLRDSNITNRTKTTRASVITQFPNELRTVQESLGEYLDNVVKCQRSLESLPENELHAWEGIMSVHGVDTEVFIRHATFYIKRSGLRCLGIGKWSNDEVIDFYFILIQERDTRTQNFPRFHFFNSFFLPKLLDMNSSLEKKVRAWSSQ